MSRLAINGGEPVRTRPFPPYPQFGEEEARAAAETVRRGILCSQMYEDPEDSQVRGFEREFAEHAGTRFAMATSSGTTALHTALAAAGIGVGDEVIVPPYTFLATATSVLMANAVPVFADIEPRTLGLDPASVRERITPRTRAVIVVHMNGYPADMDALVALARERDLVLIEDCAHAHGARHRGRRVGSIGRLGAFSFQQKKNLSLGEGGMVTTDDQGMAEVAARLRSFGGRPLGFNYRMPELQAAVGRVRLRRLDAGNEQRRANAASLDRRLHELPGIEPLRPREHTEAVYYNYVALCEEEALGVSRDCLLQALQAEGIPARSSYAPLRRHETFRTRDGYGRGCPFACPFYLEAGGEVPGYDERDTPMAVALCDRRIVDIKIHPPCDLDDMAEIADALEKVITHLDQLRTSADDA
ncbi:MAG: DegT/DnrJ/EryC1/StrS family aminotransferase [Armatimonadota bacterium]|nr:DegT/DnrJ/EryC1/StrS family aminotransferase [Armatimonadota bacterium]